MLLGNSAISFEGIWQDYGIISSYNGNELIYHFGQWICAGYNGRNNLRCNCSDSKLVMLPETDNFPYWFPPSMRDYLTMIYEMPAYLKLKGTIVNDWFHSPGKYNGAARIDWKDFDGGKFLSKRYWIKQGVLKYILRYILEGLY